jgi:hypothetical protein
MEKINSISVKFISTACLTFFLSFHGITQESVFIKFLNKKIFFDTTLHEQFFKVKNKKYLLVRYTKSTYKLLRIETIHKIELGTLCTRFRINNSALLERQGYWQNNSHSDKKVFFFNDKELIEHKVRIKKVLHDSNFAITDSL